MQFLSIRFALSVVALTSPVRSVVRRRPVEEAAGEQIPVSDLDGLWDGLDVTFSVPNTGTQNGMFFRTQRVADESVPKVHVLGLQDTGTNLLFSILWQNFRDQLVFYDSTYIDHDNLRQSAIWKHANVKELNKCNPWPMHNLGRSGVTAIAMVREPLSWMQSIRKAPYDFKACVEEDDWLLHACLHHCPAGFAKCRDTHGIAAPKEYSNLGQVWAEWNAAYANLTDYGFSDSMVVRYEDLVADPDEFIADVTARLNLKLPSDGVRTVTDAAKTHGDAVGRDEALYKIQHKTYLSDFARNELIQACQSLKPYKAVQKAYHYGNCQRILKGRPLGHK